MPRRRDPPTPEIEAVAAVTERLAVLLAAGVPPRAAWVYLDDEGVSPVVRDAAAAAAEGENIASAIMRTARVLPGDVQGAWHGLAAAWFVATGSGAPLAQSLRDLAGSFRSLGQTQRDLAVALAGPAATARMVMALPVIGVIFGMGLGFNTLQILFTTIPGLLCFAGGAALMGIGVRWNRRMIRTASPKDLTPGLAIDLMAIAMAGGGSVDRAWTVVTEARSRYLDRPVKESRPGTGTDAGAGLAGDDRAIDDVLELAKRAGVPAVELLRSEAGQRRREARSSGQRTAAALAVKLMIPLGICVLPAFMLVGIAPLLLAIISSTVASF